MDATLQAIRKAMETLSEVAKLTNQISKLPKCELRQSLIDALNSISSSKFDTTKDMPTSRLNVPEPVEKTCSLPSLVENLGWFASQWDENHQDLLNQIDDFDHRLSGDEWKILHKVATTITSLKE